MDSEISLFIPPELWDLILKFLQSEDLTKFKSLSKFFNELVNLNKGFRCRILLYKNKQENLPISEQFKWAAIYGHLEVLEWIYFTFEELMEKDIIDSAFWWAAMNGKSEVLKYLYSISKSTRENLQNIIISFKWIARNGHLETLKWLHSIFKLTKKDLENVISYAFWWAAENGRLEVLKWLVDTFKLTKKEIKCNNSHFHIIVENGYLEVLEWFHSTFNITKEEIKYLSDYNFIHEVLGPNSPYDPEIVKWLESDP